MILKISAVRNSSSGAIALLKVFLNISYLQLILI